MSTTDHEFSAVMESFRRRMAAYRVSRGSGKSFRSPLEDVEALESAMEDLRVMEAKLLDAHAQLQVECDRFEDLFQNAPDGYLITNTHGSITEANRAAAAMLNVQMKYLASKPLVVFIGAGDRPAFRDILALMRAGQRLERTLHIVPRGKLNRMVRIAASPVLNRESDLVEVRWSLRDVTDQERVQQELLEKTHAELRSLASQASLAEERERRRIATLLHDEIGQNLAAFSLKLATMQKQLSGREPALATDLRDMRELLAQAIRQTRSLTTELSPPVLYDLGLGPALQWLCEQMSNQRVSFHYRGVREANTAAGTKLPQDLSVLLFQVTRELMINVQKHARASRAAVRYDLCATSLSIRVSDNGIGMEYCGQRNGISKGYGLFSIRERVRHLGGDLKINRRRGGGTSVEVILPLSRGDTSSVPSAELSPSHAGQSGGNGEHS